MATESAKFEALTPTGDWVDVHEAMRQLGITTKYQREMFRRGIATGYIPAFRLSGRTIRIHMPTLRDKFTTPTHK